MGAVSSFLDVDGQVIIVGRFLRVETDDRGRRIVCEHKRLSGEVREQRYLFFSEDLDTGEPLPIVDQLESVESGDFVVMGVRSFITRDKTGTYMRVQSIRRVDEGESVRLAPVRDEVPSAVGQ